MTKKNIGLPRPQKRKVSLSKLTTDEQTFQPRFGGIKENHVSRLIDAQHRGSELDPISVWKDPEAGQLIVADGHHRLEAYRRTRAKTSKVTVLAYECDFQTALLIPIAENAKDRLPLAYAERANRSWKLTLETELSKATVSAACGVSQRTVGYQRKVKRQLGDEHESIPETWLEALAQAQGREEREYSEEEREAEMEAEINKADEQFGASLTKLFQRSSDAAFELMRRCAGQNRFDQAMSYAGFVELGDSPDDIARIAYNLGELLDDELIDDLAEQAKKHADPFRV